MSRVALHFSDGHVEEHAAPANGPHFMIGARHGKGGPVTWFVLERRESGRAEYVECCVTEEAA
jgi:hypothetical protein